MKRTKSSSQPTRVMPRRRTTRQNVSGTEAGDNSQRNPLAEDSRPKKRGATESNNTSESETEEPPQVRRTGRRKRKRVDRKGTAKPSLVNEVSASVDSRNNRESPDQTCSICLSAVENRAFTDACYHTFCFECLVEWSRVRAVCPLCKKSFHSIIHSFRSYDDYKLYQVPTSFASNFVNISSLNNSYFATVGRLRNSVNSGVTQVSDGDRMLALRRRVYTHSEEMQLRGLWSSDGVVISSSPQVSPAVFDCYPVMLERVRPWVLRDVTVIVGNGDVQTVVNNVLDWLRRFPITSEDFYERLFPYLGLHTRRFLLELDAFARSPFDMTTYDARVVYTSGADVLDSPLYLSVDHVEDISSGDDSDIEIVSPAVASSDTTSNSHVNLMTDHVVPDLLRHLRTYQHNLMMSFSIMTRRIHNSGLESPVPGPSGLGQAVAADEDDSVGSHASTSANGGEERSDSPMVLSDADSDIVVVDVGRSTHSPIHISSSEDDDSADQIRNCLRVKRQRRRAQADKDPGCENDDAATSVACDLQNEVPQALADSEPHAEHDCFEDSSAEELMHAAEQEQCSSHGSSSVKLNDHTSAKSSPSKPRLQTDVGKSHKRAFHVSPQKTSRNANSIAVVPESSTDDVKPLTCKKHVSGHKSSKRKVQELVAEERSSEVDCETAEKACTGEQVVGHPTLPGGGSPEQSTADIPNEVPLLSTGESSISCTDPSNNPVPVSSLCEEVKLTLGGQSDVPSTSEPCSLPGVSSLGHSLEDATSQCSPTADCKSSLSDGNPCFSCGDVVQTCPMDADELPEVATAGDNGNRAASVQDTLLDQFLSSDCIHPDTIDRTADAAEPACASDVNAVPTECFPSSPDKLSVSDTCVTLDYDDCSSLSSSDISIPAASSSCFSSQVPVDSIKSCETEHHSNDNSVSWLDQNDSSGSFLATAQENDKFLSLSQDSRFNHSNSWSHIDAGGSENKPLLDICSAESGIDFAGCVVPDRRQSISSLSDAGLIIDETEPGPASLSPYVANDVVLGSPVGIDSSDSEVECLETGVSDRQHCISISSSDSSIVYSPLHASDVESVLSDSDSLEIFDDELRTSHSDNHSDDDDDDDDDNRPWLTPIDVHLPSSSDVGPSADVDDTETVTNSEQAALDQTIQSQGIDADEASNTVIEHSEDNVQQSSTAVDERNQDSDSNTDVHDLNTNTDASYVEELPTLQITAYSDSLDN